MLRKLLGKNRGRSLSVAIPLVQAVLALARKKPKRALLLVGVAAISSRSSKAGTAAQILLRVLGRR